jgi:aryl hydrocarbon receptor nuclear translocator
VTSTANSADLNGSNNQSEFISRHGMDGKFSFVDQRVMNVLGYTPTDLLGKSCYDFFHPEDQNHMKENFDQVLKQKGQMFSVMYRFRAKNREWVWLRTQAYAFLNPYTDEVEYIVCTNSSAKTLHSGAQDNGPIEPSDQPVYQPGIDYTMQNRRDPPQPPPANVYNPHGMMPHNIPPQSTQSQQQQSQPQASNNIQRPNSAQNSVSYGYEATPSPIQNTAGIPKSNQQNTSPTPAATAWTLRQQQPVSTEGYQYSQMSPSRSPSGPTYTQLSGSGVNARQTYHTATAPQHQNHPGGMWGWQNAPQSDAGPGSSSSSGHNSTVTVAPGQHPGQPGHHPQQGQELSDMLQMLDQSGTTTFEDLNIHMFNTPFE